MSYRVRAYAALSKGQKLQPFEYDPGPLGPEQVEVAVEYCGICHSDLSMLDNEWGFSSYPFVPGHEIVGKVVAVGDSVKGTTLGDRVGIGWFNGSCMHCQQCLSGNHNLCPQAEGVMIGRHGGFAERVRSHWAWCTPIPSGLDVSKVGPLFCGGITVFNPIIQSQVRPTDRVGVIGIGGLGHLALQFLKHWGCHVVAFSSSDSKREQILKLGATEVVNSRDPGQIQKLESSLDFVLVTVNVSMDWKSILRTLKPKGTLHFVGAVLEPVPLEVFDLMTAQKSVTATPLGSPATTRTMIEFCARHQILPVTELFPMSQVNEALDRLREGKARYRIVLENDFS